MLVDDEPARVAGDERVLIGGGSRLSRQARAMPGEARERPGTGGGSRGSL